MQKALRRTLDLERRERKELESRALELIKSAKLKWEASEKDRVKKLDEEIEKQNTRITELCTSNNELTSKLERYKTALDQAEVELDRFKSLQSEHKVFIYFFIWWSVVIVFYIKGFFG